MILSRRQINKKKDFELMNVLRHVNKNDIQLSGVSKKYLIKD